MMIMPAIAITTAAMAAVCLLASPSSSHPQRLQQLALVGFADLIHLLVYNVSSLDFESVVNHKSISRPFDIASMSPSIDGYARVAVIARGIIDDDRWSVPALSSVSRSNNDMAPAGVGVQCTCTVVGRPHGGC